MRLGIDFGTTNSAVAVVGGGIDDVLCASGVAADAIDDVFLTGGTSQLPFVQQVFFDRFGRGRTRTGDSLTSVCEGLALRAVS